MRRGFKEQAKEHVLEVREEIGLDAFAPLDPAVLANAYGIDVYEISDLANFNCPDEALAHFADDLSGTFSAALLPIGTARIILDNDNHAPTRRRASLAHEMAHHLLEHEFESAILGADGCRGVNPEIESEAAWFAGELLIPFRAAVVLAKRSASDSEVSRHFGVSPKLAAMRMNGSGARKIIARQQSPRIGRKSGA